jgi:Arc/MetJ-type ribon-helix-helix transcriptional regulator
MRTTLTLDDHLFAQIRRIAAETNRSLSEVVEEALREALAGRASGAARRRRSPIRLPVCKGGKLLPGIDLDDSSALLDRMEGRDESH